jgi:hypothetical protein
LKALKIDGASPFDLDDLVTGRYPFYKTFSITIWEDSPTKNRHAIDLKEFILKQVESLDDQYLLASHSRLRAEGWRFNDGELIGDRP